LTVYAIGKGNGCNIYSEANYFLDTKDAFQAYDDEDLPGFVQDTNSVFVGNNGAAKDTPPSGHWIWNPADYYAYKVDKAEVIPAIVKASAGVGKYGSTPAQFRLNEKIPVKPSFSSGVVERYNIRGVRISAKPVAPGVVISRYADRVMMSVVSRP